MIGKTDSMPTPASALSDELDSEESDMTSGVYVHYGCGFCAPEGWENFDASPTLLFERLPLVGRLFVKNAVRFPKNVRYGDIVKGLPFAAGTVDAVYASHVLEHLARHDFYTALGNTWQLLKPGGIFRLVVPDLRWRAEEYISALDAGDANANSTFLRACNLGTEFRPRSLWRIVISLLGHSRHLWMWDEPSMRVALEAAGFRNIRRFAIGDAADPMFAQVENVARVSDNSHQELAIEAVK